MLAAVEADCDITYDELQDLAENHRNLRAMMQVAYTEESLEKVYTDRFRTMQWYERGGKIRIALDGLIALASVYEARGQAAKATETAEFIVDYLS